MGFASKDTFSASTNSVWFRTITKLVASEINEQIRRHELIKYQNNAPRTSWRNSTRRQTKTVRSPLLSRRRQTPICPLPRWQAGHALHDHALSLNCMPLQCVPTRHKERSSLGLHWIWPQIRKNEWCFVQFYQHVIKRFEFMSNV